MCHNLQAVITQPMTWALKKGGVASEVDGDLQSRSQTPALGGEHADIGELDEDEDEDEDEEEVHAEDGAEDVAEDGAEDIAEEGAEDGAQGAADYSPFAWGPPHAAPAPREAPSAESPLICLVRRMTSGLLCAEEEEEEEEGDEMERRRLFQEPEEGPESAAANPAAAAAPQVALGRYEYLPADVIGSGGFSAVRRGVDLLTGRPVAIKTYSGMEARGAGAAPEAAAELRRQFADEVRMLGALHHAPAAGRPRPESASFLLTDGLPERLLEGLPPSRELFVELLDFSRRGDAPACPAGRGVCPAARAASRAAAHRPGPALDGQCYLVLELASETLEDFLARAGPLPPAEVERVFCELCEVVAALHGRGFVHLDLKPANLMRFPCGRFKLIDMDGMHACGALVPSSEVISTSKYCAPEVALATVEDEASEEDVSLRVSRLLDVFSLGLIGVELASGAHPLEGLWCRFMEGEEEDEAGFLRCLADPGLEVPVPAAVRAVSPDLEALLGSMLRVRGRASMPEVLASPFFRARAEAATPRPRPPPPAAAAAAPRPPPAAAAAARAGPGAGWSPPPAAAPHAAVSRAGTPVRAPAQPPAAGAPHKGETPRWNEARRRSFEVASRPWGMLPSEGGA